jgi:hypothetical protein
VEKQFSASAGFRLSTVTATVVWEIIIQGSKNSFLLFAGILLKNRLADFLCQIFSGNECQPPGSFSDADSGSYPHNHNGV